MSGGLRQLLLQQITGDEQMGGMLARYNEAPAVFYQKVGAVPDTPGWTSTWICATTRSARPRGR